MYFEPSKKVYYRFPSEKSITELDNRMYFPEKPAHTAENSHYDYPSNVYIPEKEHNYDFK